MAWEKFCIKSGRDEWYTKQADQEKILRLFKNIYGIEPTYKFNLFVKGGGLHYH